MGFGSSGFGSSPYGIGTPADVDPNGGKALQNAQTSKQQGSRRINPATGDYVMNSFGRIEGMSDVQQMVLLAVSTELGSSSVVALGHELKSIDRITTNFAKRVETVLRNALAALVNDKQIEIQAIRVERMPQSGRAYVQLLWRDLTSDVEHVEDIR